MDKTFVDRARALLLTFGGGWIFPLRLLAFWLLFFAGFRIWFIWWLRSEWNTGAPWPALWNALPLDLSTAGYLMAVPMLIWFAGFPLGPRGRSICNRFINGINVPVFAFLVFVFGANIFVYQEWHTPLNNRALEYFRTPASMLDSMSFGFKLGSVAAYGTFVWLLWRLYHWLVGTLPYRQIGSNWQLAWAPVQITLLFFFIRGGLGVMPINESAVYYSPHLFDNHAATNTAWHLLHSLIETRQTENNYGFLPPTAARAEKDRLYPTTRGAKPPHRWMQAQAGRQPNLVFILMESMTAQVVAELGGTPDVCPNLSRLAKQGILFENCYSSGYRTDQGLVAVLGGFPAQPDQSIVLLQEKAAKLPSIPKMLKKQGYATSFFYGGELTFANIGVWLRNQQFEQIISEEDFSEAELTQRWGADDHQLFQKALATLRQTPQPFFSTILTLSLHPPFDVPYQSRWNGSSEAELFLNSAAFADYAIGAFFEQAAREPWFNNTLFVLVADHGHYNPGGVRMDDPRSRQVPLILTGPLLAPEWRGRRIGALGNHHDIPATILNELGFPTDAFAWSKDLLDAGVVPFAYYTNENGLGWVTPGGTGFYLFQSGLWQPFAGTLDSAACTTARAYLQTLYDDFLGM